MPAKPDASQVGEDHIRPATHATRATTAQTVAAQAALRQPGPDIDANLRPVTLQGGGKPLSGIYLQSFPTTVEVSLSLASNGRFDLVEIPRQGGPAQHLQGRYRLFGNTLDLGGERHTIHPLEGGRAGRLVFDGYDLDPAP